MQHRFVAAGTDDRGFRIIGNDGPSQGAVKLERPAVTGNPLFQLLVGEGLGLSLVAEAQHRHKQRLLADRTIGLLDRHL